MAIVPMQARATPEEREVVAALESVARQMASEGRFTRVIDRVIMWALTDIRRRRANRWLWQNRNKLPEPPK